MYTVIGVHPQVYSRQCFKIVTSGYCDLGCCTNPLSSPPSALRSDCPSYPSAPPNIDHFDTFSPPERRIRVRIREMDDVEIQTVFLYAAQLGYQCGNCLRLTVSGVQLNLIRLVVLSLQANGFVKHLKPYIPSV